jgi:hypothetical protein
MSHRSMPWRAVALTIAFALLGAGGARAGEIAVPGDAPVVAGPGASGATAVAFVHGDDLCVVTVERGEPRPATVDDGGECDRIPVVAPLDTIAFDEPQDSPDSGTRLFGVAGTDVASVALKAGARTVGQAATTPSPLPGAAADLRFFLVEDGPGAKPDELAALDASGAVRRAVGGYDIDSPFFPDLDRIPGHVLQRGRRGDGAWTLRATVLNMVSSTPLEPERRVPTACIRFATGPEPQGLGINTCDQEALHNAAVIADASATSGPVGAYVTVIARPAARRVAIVLGDGSRRDVRLQAIPGAPAGMRAGALVVGPDVALRRVVAVGAGGRTLETEPLLQAPADGTPCDQDDGSSGAVFAYSLRRDTAKLGPAPHVVQAADDGPRICLGVDRAPRVPDDCALPPVDADSSRLERRLTTDGRFVLGLVPPEVSAARLQLDDGTTRDVPAAPIPGYAGRYAALVQLVAADVPGGRRVVGYRLLDARGRTLWEIDGRPEQPAPRHVSTLLRPDGLPPLHVGVIAATGQVAANVCLVLGPLTSADGCMSVFVGGFFVTSDCALRRIVVTGLVRHRTDRVAVTTAAGREIAGHTVALPAAIGAPPGVSATLLVVPAGAAPRRLVVRGPDAGHDDLLLPPAARQCGYVTFAEVGATR